MALLIRYRELLKKYGKVAVGVHLSVSGASIAGLYVAIKNNVDVESILEKLPFGGGAVSSPKDRNESNLRDGDSETGNLRESAVVAREEGAKTANRTAELAASSGGALALAVLCNKALIPIRVPITVALTPPIARFLARRKIIKGGV